MSKGIWEKLRQVLTLVPNRSSGNPIVAWYRMPSPSSRPEAAHYKDPVTLLPTTLLACHTMPVTTAVTTLALLTTTKL